MIRILCPEPSSFSRAGLDFARRFASVFECEMRQVEFESEAPGYDAVLIRFNTRVGIRMMQGRRLKAILSPTTGLDHIDLEAAQQHKVRVYHLRGQKKFLRNISATAELAVALILAALRNLPEAVTSVKAGCWKPGPFRGREVFGKTLGIIGYGRLGSKVARVGRALGMHIVVFDPYVQRLPTCTERSSTLHSLLERSDIVSLHLPLRDETRHMIGKDAFEHFKAGAVLINTSRGAIVDSEALLIALQSGRLSAAALDVIENEENINKISQHPRVDYAREHSNLIITPHIGGATLESVEKTDLFVLRRYFKDQGITT